MLTRYDRVISILCWWMEVHDVNTPDATTSVYLGSVAPQWMLCLHSGFPCTGDIPEMTNENEQIKQWRGAQVFFHFWEIVFGIVVFLLLFWKKKNVCTYFVLVPPWRTMYMEYGRGKGLPLLVKLDKAVIITFITCIRITRAPPRNHFNTIYITNRQTTRAIAESFHSIPHLTYSSRRRKLTVKVVGPLNSNYIFAPCLQNTRHPS